MALKAYQAIYENGSLVWENDDRPADQRLRVMVIVLDALDTHHDHTEDADWHRLSLSRLQAAFGDDEPEYTLGDVAFQ